jgi:hypothetical protein
MLVVRAGTEPAGEFHAAQSLQRCVNADHSGRNCVSRNAVQSACSHAVSQNEAMTAPFFGSVQAKKALPRPSLIVSIFSLALTRGIGTNP